MLVSQHYHHNAVATMLLPQHCSDEAMTLWEQHGNTTTIKTIPPLQHHSCNTTENAAMLQHHYVLNAAIATTKLLQHHTNADMAVVPTYQLSIQH